MDFDVYDRYTISREERIRRVGEILSMGVTLMRINESKKELAVSHLKTREARLIFIGSSQTSASSSRIPVPEGVSQDLAQNIVEFLESVGEATPQELQNRFSLTRSKTYRVLKSLRESGQVKNFGNTRSIKYQLVL